MLRSFMSALAAVLSVLSCAVSVTGGETTDFADGIAAARRATVKFKDAVEIAQRMDPTSKVISAHMVLVKDQPFYQVVTSAGRASAGIRVDGVNGKTSVGTGEVSDRALINAKIGGLRSSMSLPQVLERVKDRVRDARIFSVELDTRKPRPLYMVYMLQQDSVESIVVDAVNGALQTTGKWRIHQAEWPFDRDEPDALPDGWTAMETGTDSKPSRWVVAAAADAISEPRVLRLAETVNTGSVFNLAVAAEPLFTDLDLSVQVRGAGGKEDQGGGPVWRLQDQDNYYVCRVNPLENNYRLYKVVKGKRQQLATSNAKLEPERWYQVRVTMTGDHIVCYLDGRRMMEARDAALREEGKVGVWTKADATSMFDDLRVFSMEPVARRSNDDDEDDDDDDDRPGHHEEREDDDNEEEGHAEHRGGGEIERGEREEHDGRVAPRTSARGTDR